MRERKKRRFVDKFDLLLVVLLLALAGSSTVGSPSVDLADYSALQAEANTGVDDIGIKMRGIWQTTETTSAQGDSSLTAYTLAPRGYFLVGSGTPELSKFDGTDWTSITPPPLMSTVQAIGGNGEYWLIGDGNGRVWKYDGNLFTDVTPTSPQFANQIGALGWGPGYWLVGDTGGMIQKYDGSSWTDLTGAASINSVWSIKWNGNFNYWLVGGQRVVKKFDGSSWSDISPNPSFRHRVLAIGSNGDYWLVGDRKKIIQRYDGSIWTDLTSEAGFTGDINSIEWGSSQGLFLVGGKNGNMKTYDGSSWVDQSSGWGAQTVLSIGWSEDLNYWLVSGSVGVIKSFDGTSWTDRTTSAGFSGDVKALEFSYMGPIRRQDLSVNPHTATTSGHYIYEVEVRAKSSSPPNTTYKVSLWLNENFIGTLYIKTDSNPVVWEVLYLQFDIGSSIPNNALFFIDADLG